MFSYFYDFYCPLVLELRLGTRAVVVRVQRVAQVARIPRELIVVLHQILVNLQGRKNRPLVPRSISRNLSITITIDSHHLLGEFGKASASTGDGVALHVAVPSVRQNRTDTLGKIFVQLLGRAAVVWLLHLEVVLDRRVDRIHRPLTDISGTGVGPRRKKKMLIVPTWCLADPGSL